MHRHLCDARQRAAILLQRAEVPHHEDLGMAGNGQRRFDENPADAVERGAERSPQRRRGDACGPENGLRGDSLIADLHTLSIDGRHHGVGPYLNA